MAAGRTSSASDVANVISLCKENRLICVLEDHDTTGYGEDSAAYSLDQAVDYWISIKDALVGQENYIAINIGNEPIGNTNASQWTSATTAAIQKMRDNGFEHLLIVDAPNWGQDWEYIMRDNAQTVLDADEQSNTVLSIHMYSVFSAASTITSYLDTFEANGWPLIIGEFGWQFDSSQVDDQTVLSEAVSRNLGYLGWSWAGNNDPNPGHGDQFRSGPAHHLGRTDLQRHQRHQGHRAGSLDLRRHLIVQHQRAANHQQRAAVHQQ